MTMMMKKTPWGSSYTVSLSKGCRQCINGEKLVVLVSTDCSSNCFYCPLSIERKTSHHSFANERPILNINDLILEASNMDAKGASMTGGDPLEHHSFSKTLEYCQILRRKYLRDFHIHLYSRGKKISPKILSELVPYIDEIRFHVINLKKDFLQVKLATQFDLDVGIEVPIIPTQGLDYYCNLINQFASILPRKDQFYFVNLNELEISETNYRKLIAHGLEQDQNKPSAVQGSAKLGEQIVEWASNSNTIPVHFCSLTTKDTIQLTNRLHRIATRVKLPSDVVIPDGPDKGLLIRGVIKSETENLEYIRKSLITNFHIPENLITLDQSKKRLLTNAALLSELKEQMNLIFPNLKLGIAEEYPTYDNLQTTFIPL